MSRRARGITAREKERERVLTAARVAVERRQRRKKEKNGGSRHSEIPVELFQKALARASVEDRTNSYLSLARSSQRARTREREIGQARCTLRQLSLTSERVVVAYFTRRSIDGFLHCFCSRLFSVLAKRWSRPTSATSPRGPWESSRRHRRSHTCWTAPGTETSRIRIRQRQRRLARTLQTRNAACSSRPAPSRPSRSGMRPRANSSLSWTLLLPLRRVPVHAR